jgi:hypothetical protein
VECSSDVTDLVAYKHRRNVNSIAIRHSRYTRQTTRKCSCTMMMMRSTTLDTSILTSDEDEDQLNAILCAAVGSDNSDADKENKDPQPSTSAINNANKKGIGRIVTKLAQKRQLRSPLHTSEAEGKIRKDLNQLKLEVRLCLDILAKLERKDDVSKPHSGEEDDDEAENNPIPYGSCYICKSKNHWSNNCTEAYSSNRGEGSSRGDRRVVESASRANTRRRFRPYESNRGRKYNSPKYNYNN